MPAQKPDPEHEGKGSRPVVKITYNPADVWPTLTSPGVALPPEYSATVDLPDLPFIVELKVSVVDAQPQVDEVHIARRPEDPPITARSLRDIPLRRMLAATVRVAEIVVERLPDGRINFLRPGAKEELIEGDRAAAKRRRLANPTNDAAIAAELHREALEDETWRRKPTLYVKEKMHVSRSTAARLLQRARAEGLLDSDG